MAKLRLPLLSLEARGALGESLVFFPWKGINAVRKYVIPSNPRTQPQLTQRGYITDIVALVHISQGRAAGPLNAGDTIAYSLYSRTLGKVMTWFNAVVKQCIDQKVATLHYSLLKDGTFTPGVDQVTCHLSTDQEGTAPNNITGGTWHWGTSPTALNNSVVATVVAPNIDDIIAGLTTGTKYYFQFRASAHADYIGVRSGIYFATPL